MRKFWLGLACGVVLCVSTAAITSKSIQGTLYPSKITIMNGSQVKELTTDTGTTVINYKDQTYIPLRLFSNAMGADVTFKNATSESGSLNRIQIISKSSQTGLTINSNDGILSAGYLTMDEADKGVVKGGIIRINKELSGKRIALEAIGADGSVIGTSQYFYIDDENLIPPKPGDIRPFKTLLGFAYDPKVTYRLKVQNIVSIKNNPLGEVPEREQEYLTYPLYGMMAPSSGFGDGSSVTDHPVMNFSVTLTNLDKSAVVLDETPLAFAVYSANPDGTNRKLISQTKLPSLKGKLAPNEAFDVTLPWYMTSKDGLVKPGSYLVELQLPNQIQVLNEGTGKKQPWNVSLRYGNTFGVTLK
ncbi:hypothetical protein ACX1C1_13025 [Paenibacillus sp. strain BS8-2]